MSFRVTAEKVIFVTSLCISSQDDMCTEVLLAKQVCFIKFYTHNFVQIYRSFDITHVFSFRPQKRWYMLLCYVYHHGKICVSEVILAKQRLVTHMPFFMFFLCEYNMTFRFFFCPRIMCYVCNVVIYIIADEVPTGLFPQIMPPGIGFFYPQFHPPKDDAMNEYIMG